jgi:hypothetical protein
LRETRYGRVPSECQNDIHRTDQCAISTGAPNSAEAGRWPFVGMINDHTFGSFASLQALFSYFRSTPDSRHLNERWISSL